MKIDNIILGPLFPVFQPPISMLKKVDMRKVKMFQQHGIKRGGHFTITVMFMTYFLST